LQKFMPTEAQRQPISQPQSKCKKNREFDKKEKE
jgi:hypothetical protein